MANSLSFKCIMGVVPGYATNWRQKLKFKLMTDKQAVALATKVWHKVATSFLDGEWSVYVSACIQPSRVVYNGCPAGGEPAVEITGEYLDGISVELWKECVVATISEVKKELGQKDVFITFTGCECTNLSD